MTLHCLLNPTEQRAERTIQAIEKLSAQLDTLISLASPSQPATPTTEPTPGFFRSLFPKGK